MTACSPERPFLDPNRSQISVGPLPVLYLHDDLLPVLEVLAEAVPNLPLLRDEKGSQSPFPEHAWRKGRKAANLEDLRYYDLRHGFATRLLETSSGCTSNSDTA